MVLSWLSLVYSCPDKIETHDKQEHKDSQFQIQPPIPPGRNSAVYSEQLPHSMVNTSLSDQGPLELYVCFSLVFETLLSV